MGSLHGLSTGQHRQPLTGQLLEPPIHPMGNTANHPPNGEHRHAPSLPSQAIQLARTHQPTGQHRLPPTPHQATPPHIPQATPPPTRPPSSALPPTYQPTGQHGHTHTNHRHQPPTHWATPPPTHPPTGRHRHPPTHPAARGLRSRSGKPAPVAYSQSANEPPPAPPAPVSPAEHLSHAGEHWGRSTPGVVQQMPFLGTPPV